MNIGKVVPIPLTKDTAYLAGVIIGDGHISDSTKSKTDSSKNYRIFLEFKDKTYLKQIHNIFLSIIRTKSKPKSSKRGEKERHYLQLTNKSLFLFFTEKLNIPKGAKSAIVVIPKMVKNSSADVKRHFLAGLFDTDGGFRSKSIGFTSASRYLIKDVSDLLNEFSVKHFRESWTNKKYMRHYYGIIMYKQEIGKFLKIFPLRNEEKLKRIRTKYF